MKKPLRLKLKQRWLPFLFGYFGKYLLKGIAMTCRFKVEGVEKFHRTASQGKCILMFWHNRLAMATEILCNIAPQFTYSALISKSRDGEIIAVLVNSYKNGRAIRVPHNAKSAALQRMIREIKYGNEVMVITPDGPRGPIYKVKPGIVIAAKETSANIVPLNWSANRCWKLKTWDQLFLPKPFSTITVKLGDPIALPKSINNSIDEDARMLGEALLALENRELRHNNNKQG